MLKQYASIYFFLAHFYNYIPYLEKSPEAYQVLPSDVENRIIFTDSIKTWSRMFCYDFVCLKCIKTEIAFSRLRGKSIILMERINNHMSYSVSNKSLREFINAEL